MTDRIAQTDTELRSLRADLLDAMHRLVEFLGDQITDDDVRAIADIIHGTFMLTVPAPPEADDHGTAV